MTTQIRPLGQHEIPALSSFLRSGFKSQPDEDYASEDVLRWKYFDNRGEPSCSRSLVVIDENRITGHMGLCPMSFHLSDESSIHTASIIDWLGTPGKSNGLRLLRYARKQHPLLYAMGATEQAMRVLLATDFKIIQNVPTMLQVLKPRFYGPGPKWKRPLRFVKDIIRIFSFRPKMSPQGILLEEVGSFSKEADDISLAYGKGLVMTTRSSAMLNHFLRFPGKTFSGYHIKKDGRLIGMVMLNNIKRSHLITVKLVDLILYANDPVLWRSALVAVCSYAKETFGAHSISCVASAPVFKEALASSGFTVLSNTPFCLWDPQSILRLDRPFHLTHMESDGSYL